jgi:hypothetical protein
MRKLVIAAAAALGIGAFAADASAAGCAAPFCQGGGSPAFGQGKFFFRYPLPAYQAAPWYLYWPYNAHFQTPSPLTGPYYAPPYTGGALVNPYFPAQPVVPFAPPAAATPPATLPGAVAPRNP